MGGGCPGMAVGGDSGGPAVVGRVRVAQRVVVGRVVQKCLMWQGLQKV